MWETTRTNIVFIMQFELQLEMCRMADVVVVTSSTE